MDSVVALAILGVISIALVLLITYWMIKHPKPSLSVEVVACRHGLRSDGGAFLLWTEHRVRNNGNKDTQITGLEAHFVDAQSNFQSQTLALSLDVGAGTSISPWKALFTFVPPFPFAQSFEVHFILNHRYGREVFAATSVQSDLQTQS